MRVDPKEQVMRVVTLVFILVLVLAFLL